MRSRVVPLLEPNGRVFDNQRARTVTRGWDTSMATNHIDFWFTMGSSYSYLSVMRLLEVERSTGIRFDWRPFHLLVILQEMKHVPFADKPAKSAYMWRDIERRAAMYRILASLPAPYSATQSTIANVVASAGLRQVSGALL